MALRAVLRLQTRALSASAARCTEAVPKKFLLPEELTQQTRNQAAENAAIHNSLLAKEFDYKPKYVSNDASPVTKRPVPINVELLQYKPIRLPKTHGHEVAHLKFRGYVADDLTRAAEFAARAAYYLGIPVSAVKTEKTEKRLYTVIRSPFAQAKSKENFHRVTYNQTLTAFDATPEVVDLWLSFVNKHAVDGVNYKAALHTRESLDFAEKLDAIQAADLELPSVLKDAEDPIASKVDELLKSDTFKKFFDEKA